MSFGLPINGLVYDPQTPRVDRVAQAQTVFDPFQFNTNVLDTVLLMLQSPEQTIVLKAIHHLDQFAMQYIGNYEALYKRGGLKQLYRHMDNDEKYIRRFAMKLLSQMFAVPEAKEEMLTDDAFFDLALNTYLESTGNCMVEYSAIIMNQFAKVPERFKKIISKPIENRILNCITEFEDPDITLHSITLLNQITSDRDGMDTINSATGVNILMDALKSEFISVQNAAIEALINLSKCRKPIVAQSYENPSFMERIFEIFENETWKHLHLKTIEMLRQVLKRPNVAEPFYKDMSLERFMEFVSTDEGYLLPAMDVLAELAIHPCARNILHEMGYSKLLMTCLAKEKLGSIATGIHAMATNAGALDVFMEEKAIPKLFAIIRQPNKPPIDHKEAALCLSALFQQRQAACEQCLECGGVETIAGFINRPMDEFAHELKLPFINMLTSASKFDELKPSFITPLMIEALDYTLESALNCNIFLVEVLNAIIQFVSQQRMCDHIKTEPFIERLYAFLCGASPFPTIVKKTCIDLIIRCAPYPDVTDAFLDNFLLDCLLNDKDSLVNCPNWSLAIDVILDNDLPVKMAILGQLNIGDITSDDFYATKQMWTHPRRLRQIFFSFSSPIKPIFLCNFNRTLPSWSNITITSMVTGQTDGRNVSESSIQFNLRPADPDLPKYLRILRESLEIAKVPFNLGTLEEHRRCVEIMCDIVCMKICSKPFVVRESHSELSDEASVTSDSTDLSVCCERDLEDLVEQHLTQLKLDPFDCNILPLGAIRIGSFFEKALLFKVLADRINLPCSLCMNRSDNRLVWNELALGNLEKCDESLTSVASQKAPDRTPTHIVDLMRCPGNLYAIDSQRAIEYLRCSFT